MRHLTLLVALAALVAGCDFTPTLDIDTPAHDARAVVRTILVADSVAIVRVTRSLDPYASNPDGAVSTAADAVVTLARGDGTTDTLVLRPDGCPSDGSYEYDPVTGRFVFISQGTRCGAFVGTRPLVPGETVTLRVAVPGLPPAEATVTIPSRPDLAVSEATAGADGPRLLDLRFSDPPAQPNRYYTSVLSPVGGFRSTGCVNGVCTDTSGVNILDRPYPIPVTTTDPVLSVDNVFDSGGRSFFVFTDDTFDGQARAVRLSTRARTGSVQDAIANAPLTVRLTALTPALYEAYRQSRALAIARDLPFAEPANGTSNVTGGYGFVGAATVSEVVLPAR